MNELISRAKAYGVVDAYGFAEWLVQVDEHFGPCEQLSESEIDLAYHEAQQMWNREVLQ